MAKWDNERRVLNHEHTEFWRHALLDVPKPNPQWDKPLLKKLVSEHPFIQFAYVTDLEGWKITKNITQIVDKSQYERGGLHEDYSDRSWFIEPLKDGQIHLNELYTSKITGCLCRTVSGPLRDEEDQIVGVCGMDIKFEDLAKAEGED